MTTRGLVLVGSAALLTAAGNLMLREGVTRAGGFALSLAHLGADFLRLFREPLFLSGLALYFTAAVVWFRVISTEALSSSYPLLVSLTFLCVTVGATVFFHEQLSVQKLVGLAILLLGIVVVARA